MRKFPRGGAAAIGALALALSAGAFAVAGGTAAGANAASASGPPAPSALRPGHPIQVPAGRPAAAPASVTNSTSRLSSPNWAGYVAGGNGTTFRYVAANFYVPVLDCAGVGASSQTYSAHWIGLDGFYSSSQTVEQTGVLAYCDTSASPVANYYAWYEEYPNAPVYPSITIHPGDEISASVYYNKSTKYFTFHLADLSNGQQFSVNKKCPSGSSCARNSAEAISEAPSDASNNVLPLADFGAATFNGVSITNTSGTHRGGFSASGWNTYVITEVNSSGTALDTPTRLSSASTFDDYWRASS